MALIRLALVSALLLPTIPRQQTPPPPTIKVDTRLTVVNVTVTDKSGHPVHGLKPSDFVIKEDGSAQPIRNFDEYGAAAPTIPMGPKLPPDIYTNMPSEASAKGSVNILLFSRLGALSDGYYARHQALEYLKNMPSGTRVAVLVAENGVRVLQDVTTDRDLLLGAVRGMNTVPLGGTTFAGNVGLRRACVVANEQSRLTLAAFRQVAASFAAIPGRKNLIWFTHGIPWLTNISYFRQFASLDCLDDDTQQLQAAYGMLSASQVAISTVDPRGLEGMSGTDAEGSGAISQGTISANFINRQLNQESIRDFAEKTGGQAYYNRNDLDAALGESIAANSDYYAITYTPPLAGYDGKYHSIDVKVARPGLQLTYRKGYTSLDLARLNTTIEEVKTTSANAALQQEALPPAISQFRAEMAHGAAASTELLLAARITPVDLPAQPAVPPVKGELNPKVKPNPLVRYDVVYSLPAGQVTLNAAADGTRKGTIEFDIVAYGEDGTKLNVLRQRAEVSLKPGDVADFQQKPFNVPLQLDLPPGKLFLRVGALDIPSGRSGTLEESIIVVKP